MDGGAFLDLVLSRVVDLLGGRRVLGRTVEALVDLEVLVSQGLPYRSFERVLARVAKTARERAMIEDLVTPRTTRLRRQEEGVLSAEESERVERVARMQALAERVLSSEREAHNFLYRPHPLLGDVAPLALARTELGARRVEELLWGLEHSLPV
jgi:putative toxin-antitoxin system antitoxin component (TIGR02293 family)